VKRWLALGVVAIASVGPLAAADVYRWVDDKGRTQFSDTVPDKYKSSAKKVESRVNETSSESRREAEARAAKDRKAEVERINRLRASENAPKPPAKAPVTAAAAPPDCAAQRLRYQQSQECFAPFRNANGSIRGEAAEKCGAPVPDPAAQCGAPVQ
jgi:hypothetical protein